MSEIATLPDPSLTRARETVRLPVVIVDTAPAMLATLLASTAAVLLKLLATRLLLSARLVLVFINLSLNCAGYAIQIANFS